MRLLYLIFGGALSLLILIISVAQFGSTCTWYLIGNTSRPVFVLLAIALLGTFAGAFMVLFFVTPKPGSENQDLEE